MGTHFHQPTSDDVPVVEKINYSQTFDRAPFVGVAKVYKIDRFKKRKIDQAAGKIIQETVKIENGGTTSEFLREKNAGTEGEIYPDFKPFIPEELRKHLGVYILHGLSPTPELNMNLQSQAEDNINGNEFVKRCLGPAAARRHKHFQETVKIENGGPTSEFLRENNLYHTSLPHEWFEAFLPSSMTSSWTSYTNTKALMQNAGYRGRNIP